MPKGKLAKFVQIDSDFLFGEKYKHLEHLDYIVYALIRAHWNGHNNGEIYVGLKEICQKCRTSKSSAVRSLQRLQDGGVISMIQKGYNTTNWVNVPTKWEVVGLKNLQPQGPYRKGTHDPGTAGVPMGSTVGVPMTPGTAGVPYNRLKSKPQAKDISPLSVSHDDDDDFEGG